MAITQLSAFLENRPGTLLKAVKAISDAGVNLRALSVADTKDFGILRVIVSDPQKVKEALSDDVIITQTQVIGVKMDDKAGALTRILSIIEGADINVEYVYAFTGGSAGSAYVVLRVDDNEHAENVLSVGGIKTLNDEDLMSVLS